MSVPVYALHERAATRSRREQLRPLARRCAAPVQALALTWVLICLLSCGAQHAPVAVLLLLSLGGAGLFLIGVRLSGKRLSHLIELGRLPWF